MDTVDKKFDDENSLRQDAGWSSKKEVFFEQLMDYCIDDEHTNLTVEERHHIEKILANDPEWRSIADELQQDYAHIKASVYESNIPIIFQTMPKTSDNKYFSEVSSFIQELWHRFFFYPQIRYAFIAASTIIILYGAATLASVITASPYSSISAIEQESLVVRGKAGSLATINALMTEGKFDEALIQLNGLHKFNNRYSDDPTVEYLIGIVNLATAEKSFLGLFTHYDREKVLDGTRSILEALRQIKDSTDRSELQDACRYALGKASLMLQDETEAKIYFTQVIERNNPYRSKARQILSKLNR